VWCIIPYFCGVVKGEIMRIFAFGEALGENFLEKVFPRLP